MATKKKLLQAAAGQAGGAALNVEEVFSTYLYAGDSTSRSITNGIDLSGEGGMVWLKARSTTGHNHIADTERGGNKWIYSNLNSAQDTVAYIPSFNSDGFSMSANGATNANGTDYASWTFRKAPKFFDVVTYTGDGTFGRLINHNLDSVPGAIIIKCTSHSGPAWAVFHRGLDASAPQDYVCFLNTTAARADGGNHWYSFSPTSTQFKVGGINDVNGSGRTYVAYLFAHNNGDGEFGPDGDADIIKCGSYTGNGSSDGPEINLGFEPQWVLIKNTTQAANWRLVDVMRGFDYNDTISLYPNLTAAEGNIGASAVVPTPTGFKLVYAGLTDFNTSGNNYIYMAIRRGPMAVPESATDVFDISYATDANDASFPVDFMLTKIMAGGNGYARDRLRGGTKYLLTDTTNADISGTDIEFDDMTGTGLAGWGTGYIHYNWKRAPNYFDVVAYSGNYTARTINHNLDAVPEMMWVKKRSGSADWTVYHKDLGATKYIEFNTFGAATNSARWNDTAPTSSVFTLGDHSNVNATGDDYIAYLFASLDGISKVGSYTGNGSSQTIDCGFSSGARFVLIKQTDTSGANWFVFDSERGIVSGNDSALRLNTTDAAVTNEDAIDPVSSGFSVTNSNGFIDTNNSGGTYIFYAIA